MAIDDIKVKVGLDVAGLSAQADSVNTALNKIKAERTAIVRVSLRKGQGWKEDQKGLKEAIAALGEIPVKISKEGLNADAIRGDLEADFAKHPVAVPVTLGTKLTKPEANRITKDIETELGRHKVIVTVDWQFAAEPIGGWPTGGAAPGGPEDRCRAIVRSVSTP